MRLADLLPPELDCPPGAESIEIAAVTADSRSATLGALFAALPGTRADGTRFVPEAIEKGATAILVPFEATLPPDITVPVIRAPDARRALALMAARMYAGQPETAVAVTGTNGKTSVVEFTRQIFATLDDIDLHGRSFQRHSFCTGPPCRRITDLPAYRRIPPACCPGPARVTPSTPSKVREGHKRPAF